ncbi:MAG: DUF1501 domain-containing protein [Gemmataceae bacterium]
MTSRSLPLNGWGASPTRRQVLLAGAAGLAGATLGEGAGRRGRGAAKSVLFLFLHGGAPTQDMFDLKPDAPVEVRGEFRPIATSAPGVRICEHLPRMAKWMHRAAIVRTVGHKAGCHNTLPAYTGYVEPITDLGNANPNHPPSMGSVCEFLRGDRGGVPAYVYLPVYLGYGDAARRPGIYGGFLGQRYDPFLSEIEPYVPGWVAKPYLREHPPHVEGLPRIPNGVLREGLTAERLKDRRDLLSRLEQSRRGPTEYERTRGRAFDALTSATLRSAFDLDGEATKLRDRYGRTMFGQSCLIGRKFVERGVQFVNVTWEYFSQRLGIPDYGWDTHMHNFVILKDHYLPALDQTYSALLEDLDSRGLLDETLVVLLSDFGRTPRVNKDAGRDHWTYCYSVVFAGAGIRGGTVHGASDRDAAFPRDNPVSPADICATIYECLGIDPDTLIHDRIGRPQPIALGGKPIRSILA